MGRRLNYAISVHACAVFSLDDDVLPCCRIIIALRTCLNNGKIVIILIIKMIINNYYCRRRHERGDKGLVFYVYRTPFQRNE